MANLFEGKNWDTLKEGLSSGLSDQQKSIFGQVLENTKKHMLKESASMGATTSGNVATLNKIVLPILRRVMPNVIANNLIGVQAIQGPVAQINTLRLRYADTFGGANAGQEALAPLDIAAAYSGNGAAAAPKAAATAQMEGFAGKRMNVQIVKQLAEAETRRLSARWTMEVAQDADNQYGVDMEAEIMATLAQEITQEIDQEVLYRLRALARTGATYDMTQNADFTGVPTFVGDCHAVLTTLIKQQANLIAARTRRGAGNWIVVSPNQLSVLESATTSAFARTTEGTFESADNQKLAGVLNGNIKVFVDTYATDSTPLLIGYKGTREVDAGAYFCPYVPLTATEVMTDPNTFEKVVGFMTRYAYVEFTDSSQSFGNSADFFSKIEIPANSLKFI